MLKIRAGAHRERLLIVRGPPHPPSRRTCAPCSVPLSATEMSKSRLVHPWENQAVRPYTDLLPSTGYHGFVEGHHIRQSFHSEGE